MKRYQRILNKVLNRKNQILFGFRAKNIKKRNSLFCFDIDNTLADTWPLHLQTFNSETEKFASISPLSNMIAEVHKAYESSDVIFLSSRKATLFLVTYLWLKKFDIPVRKSQIILVRSPIDKLPFLKIMNDNWPEVTFFDDMSGNHENGKVLYYEDVIEELKKYPRIKHYGYEDILSIVNR